MHETLIESDPLAGVQHVDLVQEISELHHFPQLVLRKLASTWNQSKLSHPIQFSIPVSSVSRFLVLLTVAIGTIFSLWVTLSMSW